MVAGLLIPIIAVTIMNGNTSTATRVNTSVSGDNAQVTTNVTTTVNGQTITVTSNEPGNVTVTQDSTGSNVVINGQPITPTLSQNPTATVSATQTIGKRDISSLQHYVSYVFKHIATVLSNYFEIILDKL